MTRLIYVAAVIVVISGCTAVLAGARSDGAIPARTAGSAQADKRPPKPPPPRIPTRPRPQGISASDRVTTNTGWVWVSGTRLFNISSAYAGIAAKAAAVCGDSNVGGTANIIAYLRGVGIVGNIGVSAYSWALWAALRAYTGMQPCGIASQAAQAAYWTGRYWAGKQGMWTWLWIQQEDRTLAVDRCHVWHNFYPKGWLIHDMVTVVVPGSGGCPRD